MLRRMLPLFLLFAAGGCTSSLTITVVDADAGFAPLAGATVEHYASPRHRGDPWPTTPADVRQTGADGKAKFDSVFGRFVAIAPGGRRASFSSAFAPSAIELGVGGTAK